MYPLSNTHQFQVRILQMQKNPQTGISKQRGSFKRTVRRYTMKIKPKDHTSNDFINYYENCVLFDLQIPFAA